MQKPGLFTLLPDYIVTPDGMEKHRSGDLILSCPNYADDDISGCVVRIDRTGAVKKWFQVPVHPETGVARNMGIALDGEGAVYLCDNQGWTERPEVLYKGRILRVVADDDGRILEWNVVAWGMEHPNGIRIRGDYMYVTQSYLHPVRTESGNLLSCVYRFRLTDRDIHITNTLSDKNILCTFETRNPACQYGADGIAFDREGRLYVGNFGDGEVWRVTLGEDGSVADKALFAADWSQLESTDGMCFDENGNLYVADFCANAIACVYPDGRVERIAQSPDSDGLNGELDQPGEPIVWNGKLIASCFDLVVGPGKVNTRHTLPATLSMLDPVPSTTPDPDPSPRPTPDPDPSPRPTPDPDPSPRPTPDPDPSPRPTPDPGPSPRSTPDPDPSLTTTPEHDI